jgi:hypothetical protein
MATGQTVQPAVARADVENVAPGGISTAFVATAAPPTALPDFPEHYNEDYVWLHSFERAGWLLRQVAVPLIHAPPGDVDVTASGLSFQIYGEIVWLAVLEQARFPVDDPAAMASAVEEIAGDIRSAFADQGMAARHTVAAMLSEVLDHYEAIGRQFSSLQPGPRPRDWLTTSGAAWPCDPSAGGRSAPQRNALADRRIDDCARQSPQITSL